jgi:hypothetical protein
LGHIADIAIEAYALESSILRAENWSGSGKNNRGEAAIPADITRVYASDAADRMEHSARQIEAALEPDTSLFANVGRFASAVPYNTVAARRRIADAILQAGRYYL